MRLFRRGVKAASTATPTRASVDVATVAHRFNYEWAMDPDNGAEQDTYWWWARSIRVDPDEVWADDGEGNLWVIPFTTDGEDTVTFGEPQQSRLVAIPVSATDGVAATAVVGRRRQRVLAAALDQPTKPDPTTAATARPNNEEHPMRDSVRRALARLHGLDPDAATEEQVQDAVDAAATENEAETPEPETPAAEVETPELVAASTATTTDGVRAALGLPSTATDEQVRDRVAELEANARAGASAAERQTREDRDRLVSAAVSDGRIPPSARQAWRAALDARPDAETEALAALPVGRIPVADREVGHAASGDTDNKGTLNRALAASGLGQNRRESANGGVIHRG